ncbi:MAG: fused MFS/spermidine synthase [Bryobacteraceae bacterium]
MSTMSGSGIRGAHSREIDLFTVSALFLFLELAFIRWLPAEVLFLTFFTNTVLLASFLGLSLGCLVARRRLNYLPLTSFLLALGVAMGSAMEWVRLALQDVIDVGGNKASPQMVYFGTEARISDVASFAVPMEIVVGVFFVLVALTMVGIGQLLGRSFASLPNSITAYMINIGGSLAGVLFFQLCSWWLSPVWWFSLAAAGILYFLMRQTPRSWWAAGSLALVPLLLIASDSLQLGVIRAKFPLEFWSPYYRINYSDSSKAIVVNLLGHQNMVSRRETFPAYAIPYLLNRDSGHNSFRDILIIGAGSGNDVSRALQWAAADAHIDAVEIDPVIQSLGMRDHPDHPYQDARVTVHLGDGRNFLRSTPRKYDLIVFALIDSLVLHSSVSDIRLESYLFTNDSFTDVRNHLKPDGLFVMYNYFRQGWIVSRLAKTLSQTFTQEPVVLTLPFKTEILANEKADGFTLFLCGSRSEAVKRRFLESGSYFMPKGVAPGPNSADGFGSSENTDAWRLAPAKVELPADVRVATDSWPFLYLRRPMIPNLSWRGMAVIGAIALLLLWLVARPAHLAPGPSQLSMMLLGAGFMLLETKAIVEMALVYGSTWVVNTAVFSAILLLILAANLCVLKLQPSSLTPYYSGLLAALLFNVAVPLSSLLGLPLAIQGIAAGLLVLSPVFFAGVIFAILFRGVPKPDEAIAYNTAGAILGGLMETCSLLIGFRYLTLVAAAIYVASWAAARAATSPQASPDSAHPTISATARSSRRWPWHPSAAAR